MRQRQRPEVQRSTAFDAGDIRTDAPRAAAWAHADAARLAIERALSRDSTAFLRAAEQQSGQ